MDLADFTGYSLRRQLGSGPAGTVWQVRDRTSGRNAVLKQIPISSVPDPRRLREDLSMLARIRHPHLARVIEFRETETELVVISQYVPAGSLARLLSRRGPLSRGELVTLLVPLTEAVAYLHRSHLNHGSITLHNVLLDADGRPVLTDAALHPALPTADLHALTTLSHQAGADPTVFTTDLFTKTPPDALRRRLLALATPIPIDLAVPKTPPSLPPVTTAAVPPTPPAVPPVTPADPPVTSADQPVTSANPPVAPAVPPDTRALPPVTPANPPATPADPPVWPADRAVTSANPPVAPAVPPLSPAVPPANPSVSWADTADAAGSAGSAGDVSAVPVGTPDDPAVIRVVPSAGPDLSALLSAPRPKTSDETPGDDDPIALSRGPLAAPPPKPPTAPPTPPHRPEQSSTPTGGSTRSRPRRRTRSRRGRVLRNLPHPPHGPLAAAAGRELHRPLSGTLTTAIGDVFRRSPFGTLTAAIGDVFRRSPFGTLTAAIGDVFRRSPFGIVTAEVGRVLRRAPYGTLGAVGLGAIVVLAISMVTFRTLDAPATAQADPTHPESTHPQATRPATSTKSASPTQPTTSTKSASPAQLTSPVQTKTLPAKGRAAPSTRRPEPTTPASADPVAWTRTLQALDAQRARAFSTLDLEALDRIYVPGSSPWRSDHALLSSYRKQRIRVEGLRVQIDSSTIARRTPTAVILKTTDHLAAGQAVDQTGTKTPLPRGTPTTKLITLTTNPTTGAWRITAITQV